MNYRYRENVVRSRVSAGEPRIDGRKDMICVLVRTGVLPRITVLRVHPLKRRLVTATLYCSDAQVLDELMGERTGYLPVPL